MSDIIIRGGENISAQEVEEQLIRLPSVAEVAVVAEPDDRLGERAAAIVRMLPGEAAPTLEDVRAHLAEVGLAKQKWPESIHPVVDLPRTPSGKVQKFKLRQQLREGALEQARSRPPSAEPPPRRVRGVALADGQRGPVSAASLLGHGIVDVAVGDDVGLAGEHAGDRVGRRDLGRGEVGVGHRPADHGGEVVLGDPPEPSSAGGAAALLSRCRVSMPAG